MRISILTLLLLPLVLGAQIAADCADAVALPRVGPGFLLQTDEAPQGPGQRMEIEVPRPSPYFFRREHHSAWYTFQAPYTALMTLEVTPANSEADYDFVLFEDSTGDFCATIGLGQPLPLRSVISRNDPRLSSRTGLRWGPTEKHIGQGPNPSYAAAVVVGRGRRYYLALDNVYGHRGGHRIELRFLAPARLTGELKQWGTENPLSGWVTLEKDGAGGLQSSASSQVDEAGKFSLEVLLEIGGSYQLRAEAEGHRTQVLPFQPTRSSTGVAAELVPEELALGGKVQQKETQLPLAAKVLLLDKQGNPLDSLRSEEASGQFGWEGAELAADSSYQLLFQAEGHFDRRLHIQLTQPEVSVLAELRPNAVGQSLHFEDIKFRGGLAEFIPSAASSLQELLDIMRDNPTLRIRVEGHVNGSNQPGPLDKPKWQELSRNRAEAVRRYLVQRGIAAERIEAVGFAALRMRYPNAADFVQMQENRRVEVVVLGY